MSELTSPPPPPYEPSEQEFDQKLSRALEASTISDIRPLPDIPVTDSDIWQEYKSEAAFEAAFLEAERQRRLQDAQVFPSDTDVSVAASLIQSSGIEKADRPSTPSVQPLRIHKKAPSSSYSKSKERPSWYAGAQLGESSSLRPLAISNPCDSDSHYDEVHSLQTAPSQQRFISERDDDDDDDDAAAPPPFASEGPDLNGPPFEEEEQVVMAYRGSESAPPSPLSSPRVIESPVLSPSPPLSERIPSPSLPRPEPILPSRMSQARAHNHHSLPPPPRPFHRMGPRPTTGYKSSTKIITQARLGFDPSVAYTRPTNDAYPRTQESISINAAAFYNSAVSAHLSAASSRPVSRVNQSYISPTDNRQSQYFPQQSSFQPGGLIYRSPSPAWPMSHFSPHSPQASPMQASFSDPQPYPQRSLSGGGNGNPQQMRWTPSEHQMPRDFL